MNNGWLPIESAPKDGTRVLLFVEYGRIQVHGGYFDNHPKCKCWIAGGYMQKINEPQWWHPLPELPINSPPGGRSGPDG